MTLQEAAQHWLQPTFTRAAFNDVDLRFGVLGRPARLEFNERVNAAEPCRSAAHAICIISFEGAKNVDFCKPYCSFRS